MGLVKRTYVDGETVITAANLNDIQDEIIQNASDISTKGTYSKPTGGIPSTDMTTAVQTSLGKADTALQSSDIDNTLTVSGKAADAKKTGDEISGVKNTLNHKADVIYDTVSGDIASFPDGADGLPVKDLTVAIEPVQDLHGYDHPWPAGGGKNKLNLSLSSMKSRNSSWSWNENVATNSGITLTVYTEGSDNVTGIKADGQNNSGTYLRFTVDVPTLTKDVTYTLSGAPSGYSGSQATIYLGNSTATIGIENPAISNGVPATFTPTQTGAPNANINFDANVSVSNAMFYPMIEVGSSATSFEPTSNICPISGWTGCNISHSGVDTSNPTVIPISWQSEAGTVYGGALELPSCVLTVDKELVTINPNSNFGQSGTYPNVYWCGTSSKTQFNQIPISDRITFLSPRTATSLNEADYFNAALYSNYTGFNIKLPFTNLSDAKQYLTDNPVSVLFGINSPVVYQLTPTDVITTILGRNNIWADCGPSTVEYPCDTKLYIQKINTPTDDDMIADANIASGQYFIVNNNLYISTAAILAGDPIKPGTNCTLTNLAAALNAINS